MKTKYPFQIDSIVHKSGKVYRTLGMEANLFSPPEESEGREPSAPLEMHEGYSRFKGTLITKEGTNRKFVTFNIPAKEVPYIHKKTTMVMENALSKKLNKAESATGSGDSLGPAYTVRIASGTLKGKTPAQLLRESATNKTALLNQKKWLEDNLGKFPANKMQIDAIDEAIKLFDEGTLFSDSSEAKVENTVEEIYKCPPKNIQPTDERGYYTIYDVSIMYDSSKNMPYEITTMNCLAPVDKTQGNKIVMSKADNKKTLSMTLSESEWFGLIDTMKTQKNLFENLTYPEQLKLANKISKENRMKAV